VTVGQDAPNPNGPLPDPTADPGAIETGAATAIPTDNRPSSRSFLFFDRTQSVFGEDLRIRHGQAVLGDAGAVSLALSAHLSSPGGDPDQYEEEQSGKHIAGVYIFEAGPAGWTGIEDCLCPR
jgi:hypothetical protein